MYFGTNIFKSDEELIRQRVQALEDAYNEGDYDAVWECMDSTYRARTEQYMDIMDNILGDGGITGMFGMSGSMGTNCGIEILDIQINGDTAIVSIISSATMFGTRHSKTGTYIMVKESGDWYISDTTEDADSENPYYSSYAC